MTRTDGQFTAGGVLTRQGGTGQAEQRLATFDGRVRGDRMTLVVAPANLGLGPYDMRRDQAVDIIACP